MAQGSWRWGILGAGAAANGMAAALQAVNGGIQASPGCMPAPRPCCRIRTWT